jgi:hypothetical protein
MKKSRILSSFLIAVLASVGTANAQHQFAVNAKPGGEIQSTMYGIFFEDINFGADGGLYAEMVENRSFEFPNRLMGWNAFGNVTVSDVKPAFDRNPHYVTLENAGHDQKFTGLENRGFFGMGLKKDMKYDFSVYARLHDLQGKSAKIRVEIVGDDDVPIDKQSIEITGNQWQKYTVTLTSTKTVEKGLMRIFLESADGVDLDHVSLFPEDNWHGLRADLVKALEDLHPGIFRFPGGCIVEGTDLETRYQWKNTVGDAENRPLNENRWNYTFPHRMYPNYYQTYGLGFYEFFLLSEKIGAQPLPVLSCGLACQFQNKDTDQKRPRGTRRFAAIHRRCFGFDRICQWSCDQQMGQVACRHGTSRSIQPQTDWRGQRAVGSALSRTSGDVRQADTCQISEHQDLRYIGSVIERQRL